MPSAWYLNLVRRLCFFMIGSFFSRRLVLVHKAHRSYFVARLKRNAHKKVMSFFSSRKMYDSFRYEGVRIYLIKIKTPKGVSVFATNLPQEKFTRKEIGDLYKLRWQVESVFYDLSTTCNLERWHSKSYNGILQEFYLRMWLINATRLLIRPYQKHASVSQKTYRFSSNFYICEG